jgi:hypothetical protein
MTIEIEMNASQLTFADLKVGEAFKCPDTSNDVLLKMEPNDFSHRSGREANCVSLTGAVSAYHTHPNHKVARVTLKCKVVT